MPPQTEDECSTDCSLPTQSLPVEQQAEGDQCKTHKRKYFFTDASKVDLRRLALASGEERRKIIDAASVPMDSCPSPNLTSVTPMPVWEEAAVVILFFCCWFVLAGWPLLALPLWIIYGQWRPLVAWVVTFITLAGFPMKKNGSPVPSPVLISLFRYFSFKVVWTEESRDKAELSPYIGFMVPHGAFPVAGLLSIPLINLTVRGDFIGAAASVVLHFPILNMMKLLGMADVSRASLVHHIKTRRASVGVMADGIAGIFNCWSKEEVLFIKDRKGLAKLAIQLGVPVCPVMAFGNTKCFRVWYDRYGYLERLSRAIRVSVFFLWGRFLLPIPFRQPLVIICAPPVHPGNATETPTQHHIDTVHEQVLGELQSMFEEHKAAYGWAHKQLIFK
ncbi:unnamed protein product [Vitrella brassicaformis CCMP3155]|uniref:Acyltransferase n=2 Tax=Vitrella brassicaformis TaxID=1169539 RepID=A0A0G4F7L8_VITBC|nr:unnamed protein product [Vitrella brassicaformis CCMP3155]|eukprot:CEM08001.1 unnamed protein product [Vitrella brassicaformis CCMP3155]